MNEDIPELFSIYGEVRLCLVDWEYALGKHFKKLKPLLVKCVGEITHSYPAPETRIRLDVDRRDDCFLAYPTEEVDFNVEDIVLTLKDVQLWCFDPAKVAAFQGNIVSQAAPERPVARVIGSFQAIALPSGRKMLLGTKFKRRAFLRAVDAYCTAHRTDTFFAQTIIEDYNASLDPSVRAQKAIKSDRVMDDLFKGQKAEFNELFEILDLSAGHFRLKMPFKHPGK